MGPLGALLWSRRRMSLHLLRSVRRESKLKVAFVSLSALGLWLGIFALARFGFGLFEDLGAELLAGGRMSLGDVVMARLLSLLAAVVFALLGVSNVLVAYATFFRSREMPYLVQSPIDARTLFVGRFVEVVSFSSWATAFLGTPVLLAYGLATGAPPVFYAAAVLFYLPFVVLPAALGSMVAITLVRLLGRLRHRAGWLVGSGVLLLALLLGWLRMRLALPDLSDPSALQALFQAVGRSQSPFLPSEWLARGILASATGDVREAVFQLGLLVANAALGLWLATELAGAWLLRAFSDLVASDEQRAPGRARGVLGRLETLLAPLPEPTRSLVAKDLRLFWRDASQWSQFLIFFGLLAVYLLGSGQAARSLGAAVGDQWRAWGTILNLTASLLILASLTTRFMFPLISLEGRRFWILGLAPLTRRQVLWQKFWLSVATCSLFTVGLAILSAIRLDLEPYALGLSVGGVVAATLALSALAVGLGALYPNFEEDNPSRIVSGLGGTLNFLLSMVYIVAITLALALALLWRDLPGDLGTQHLPWITLAAALWIAALTTVAVWLPMRLGLRHLEAAEI
ncbi:MAG: hypothetical protein AAGC60_17840 [Acidobacteriota bacterium]